MDEILGQLVGLLIGSVPTIVIFVFLLAAYRLLVHTPLQKILAERRARTSGAVEKAKAAIAAAEARTAQYEQKLREARVAMMQAHERRVQQWHSEREAAIESLRNSTKQQAASAISEIEQSAAEARTQIEQMAGQLAAQITQAVMPSAGRAR